MGAANQYQRHECYYLADGDLYLLVENTLFRVHSYFFIRDSSKFQELFSTPSSPDQPRPGSSKSNPIIIENASPPEFCSFLWVIYNEKYSDYSSATVDEWTSILKIACENRFTEIQHCAIRGIDECAPLTTVQKVKIYESCGVGAVHIAPLYIKLAIREAPPSEAETTQLGETTTLKIFRLREKLRSQRVTSVSSLPAGVDESQAARIVCAYFKIDPASMIVPGDRMRSRTRTATTLRRKLSLEGGSREVCIYGDDFFFGLGRQEDLIDAASTEENVAEAENSPQGEVGELVLIVLILKKSSIAVF